MSAQKRSDQAKQLKPKGTSSFLNVMWLLLCLSKTVVVAFSLSIFFCSLFVCLFVRDTILLTLVCVCVCACDVRITFVIFACLCNQYMGDNLHTYTGTSTLNYRRLVDDSVSKSEFFACIVGISFWSNNEIMLAVVLLCCGAMCCVLRGNCIQLK